MEIQSGRISPEFKLHLSVRTPTTEKEYTTIQKKVLKITKTYPEFKKDALLIEAPKEKEIVNIDNTKNENIKKDKNIKNIPTDNKPKEIPKNNPNPEKKVSEKLEEKISSSEFSKEELEDPDILDNLNSVKVMEIKVERFDAKIKKMEGRPPQKLRQEFLQLKCRYNSLKNQIMENSISLDDYIKIVSTQLYKDKKLYTYFKQNDMKEKMTLVYEKINIMLKEIEEAKSYLKK